MYTLLNLLTTQHLLWTTEPANRKKRYTPCSSAVPPLGHYSCMQGNIQLPTLTFPYFQWLFFAMQCIVSCMTCWVNFFWLPCLSNNRSDLRMSHLVGSDVKKIFWWSTSNEMQATRLCISLRLHTCCIGYRYDLPYTPCKSQLHAVQCIAAYVSLISTNGNVEFQWVFVAMRRKKKNTHLLL